MFVHFEKKLSKSWQYYKEDLSYFMLFTTKPRQSLNNIGNWNLNYKILLIIPFSIGLEIIANTDIDFLLFW